MDKKFLEAYNKARAQKGMVNPNALSDQPSSEDKSNTVNTPPAQPEQPPTTPSNLPQRTINVLNNTEDTTNNVASVTQSVDQSLQPTLQLQNMPNQSPPTQTTTNIPPVELPSFLQIDQPSADQKSSGILPVNQPVDAVTATNKQEEASLHDSITPPQLALEHAPSDQPMPQVAVPAETAQTTKPIFTPSKPDKKPVLPKVNLPRRKAIVYSLLALVTLLVLIIAFTQRKILVAGLTGKSNASKTATTSASLPDNNSQQQAMSYIAEISKLMELPKDENPTVAAITDVNKLVALNPFFKKAKNGDIVIIYSTKAIIYDPVKKVIIDTAPVRIQDNKPEIISPETTTTPSASSDVTATPQATASAKPKQTKTASSSAMQ